MHRWRRLSTAAKGRAVIFLLSPFFMTVGTITSDAAAPQTQWSQNSTLKRRVSPNAIASQVGSQIPWESDVEVALAKSRASGKPVFWYVPRLPDTFMDRVESIDVYMRAGPFSWPQIIAPINRSFIPLAAVPNRSSQKRFDLKRYRFIEPGFLVVATDATTREVNVLHRTDRLTTLHVPWLTKMISRIANEVDESRGVKPQALDSEPPPAWLVEIRQAFEQRDYGRVQRMCEEHAKSSNRASCERDLRLAMATFRLGKHQTASSMFTNVATRYPNHPLGQKSAAEAQGIGPFVRGFEVHATLPAAAMKLTASSGVDPASPVYDSAEIRTRCVDYLLSMQDESGGVFDSDYDFGGVDSLPNVHVAVTAICGLALLNQLPHHSDDQRHDSQRRQAILSAVVRAARFTADNSNLAFTDRDEIFWALAYRLELWAALKARGANMIADTEIDSVVDRCTNDLVKIQSQTGSWFHEYANPFVTATGVMTLHRASGNFDLPADCPAKAALVKAVRSLARQRDRSGTFPYQEPADGQHAQPSNVQSAAGRMPLCEAALFATGDSSAARLQNAIEASFTHQKNLESAYKYDNHTDNWAYGGFFYWFDMRGRKQAIDLLPPSDSKKTFKKMLESIVISKSEIDGCFVDSHEIGRCYGTAMALLCLPR